MPKKEPSTSPKRPRRPAMSDKAREDQCVALAMDLAEQQLRDGTASSQVITHFLKVGSSKEKLEREIMEKQEELLRAKTDLIKANQRDDEFYNKVLNSLRSYRGEDDE